MILVYKFLFKKRVEIAATKMKIGEVTDEQIKEHNERFMRKVYDDHVASFRRRMFTLMMQEEPLISDAASLCTEIEDTERDEADTSTSGLQTEMHSSQPNWRSGLRSIGGSMVNLEELSPLKHKKSKLELTDEYMALSAIKEKKADYAKKAAYL